jgi:hypothetical protein
MLFPQAHGLLQKDTQYLRTIGLQCWRSALLREFRAYMCRTHGTDWGSQLPGGFEKEQYKAVFFPQQTLKLLRDGEVGEDAIRKDGDCSWWNWDRRSTLFFWRWPAGEQRMAAWDGMKAHISDSFPNYQARAHQTKINVYKLLLPKIQKIIDHSYVKVGEARDFVKSSIDYFIVPKADDVRPVYNGTSCGFNAAVWAPNFWLPTAKSATRVLDYNYCGVDIDLGEMILNFPLPQAFRQFSGIDLGQFKSDLGKAY